MEKLPMLSIITVLVGLTALALVATPLAVFMLQYYKGGFNVSMEVQGDIVEVVIYYNITVPLDNFTVSVAALSPNGEVLESSRAHADSLKAGDTLSLELNATKLLQAESLRIDLAGRIAGLYYFNVSLESRLGG